MAGAYAFGMTNEQARTANVDTTSRTADEVLDALKTARSRVDRQVTVRHEATCHITHHNMW